MLVAKWGWPPDLPVLSRSPIFCPPGQGRYIKLYPIVAKAGWFQSRGIKGEAVIIYRNPLITKDLESSGFPRG
jgi:hypothetical protein